MIGIGDCVVAGPEERLRLLRALSAAVARKRVGRSGGEHDEVGRELPRRTRAPPVVSPRAGSRMKRPRLSRCSYGKWIRELQGSINARRAATLCSKESFGVHQHYIRRLVERLCRGDAAVAAAGEYHNAWLPVL